MSLSGASLQFVAFGLVVALLVAARRSSAWRRGVILLASLFLLALFTTTPLAFVPLAAFVLGGYAALRASARISSAGHVALIAVILLVFVWLKKYAFVPPMTLLTFAYVTIGLSYMLFRLLHLVIEARSEPALASLPFATYLEYLIAFTTLVAGPIEYFDEFREEETAAVNNSYSLPLLGEAAQRIAVGLFKTNVLAAGLANWRAGALANLGGTPVGATGHLLNAGAVFALYPFFLYCNFSGYIDIVVGLSRLMLHRLPENFDRPFSSTSFIEFWNRWHITLSRWLRTYVYNPLLLTLMRRFPSERVESVWAVLAFFVTFFLVGVWHGQTVAFLFFGFLQGFGVSVNKMYELVMTRWLGRKAFNRLASRPWYDILSRGLTFTWFAFTLTWFWASWSESVAVWSARSVGEWVVVWAAILLAASAGLAVWEMLHELVVGRVIGNNVVRSRRLRTAWVTAMVVIVFVAVALSQQSAPDIVYKNF